MRVTFFNSEGAKINDSLGPPGVRHPGYAPVSGIPVLPENVIFTFFSMFRTFWCYSEAYNTGM